MEWVLAMNKYLVVAGMTGFVFLLGFLRVSSVEDVKVSNESSWVGTELRERPSQEELLKEIGASSRWEIIVPEIQEEKELGANFSLDYRLVGIVDNEDDTYALLAMSGPGESTRNGVTKVVVGDKLPSDWVVTEIQNAMVVAIREDESQRVELFPSK